MSHLLPLNVIISREGSLSRGSRSGTLQPFQVHHVVGETCLPQQITYQDAVVLFRRWQDSKETSAALEDEVATLRSCLAKGHEEAKAARQNAVIAAQATSHCEELEAKLKTKNIILDTSTLELAKMSRKLAVKSRKLDEAQQQIARIPTLKLAIERLLEDRGRVENALGAEIRKSEEERHRSRVWSHHVDELSLQAAKNAERCRELMTQNLELGAELERLKDMLEQAKTRDAEGIEREEKLRLTRIEVSLLKDELEAVRADCGRLVELIGSTKEYSHFRRLWDDSGGLTHIDNTVSYGRCAINDDVGYGYRSTTSGGCLSPTSARALGAKFSRKSSISLQPADAKLLLPPPPPEQLRPTQQPPRQYISIIDSSLCWGDAKADADGRTAEVTEQSTADGAQAAAAAAWEEAMRSEWSSPSEKIFRAATTTETVNTAAGAAGAAEEEGEKGEKEATGDISTARVAVLRAPKGREEDAVNCSRAVLSHEEKSQGGKMSAQRGAHNHDDGGDISPDCGGGRRAGLAQAVAAGRASISSSSGETVAGAGRKAPVAAWGASIKAAGERMQRPTSATAGMAVKKEFSAVTGDARAGSADVGGGTRGGTAAREAVRWGRLDLMSVLYPTPRVPDSKTRPRNAAQDEAFVVPTILNPTHPVQEASMWVPREAATLCRRFLVDFDGERCCGVLLPESERRGREKLFGLLVRLNAAWRKSEQSHLGRVRSRYRAKLAAARRRLEMNKPLKVVTAERDAERRRRYRASSFPGPTGGDRPSPPTAVWGIDGRRVRGVLGRGNTGGVPSSRRK